MRKTYNEGGDKSNQDLPLKHAPTTTLNTSTSDAARMSTIAHHTSATTTHDTTPPTTTVSDTTLSDTTLLNTTISSTTSTKETSHHLSILNSHLTKKQLRVSKVTLSREVATLTGPLFHVTLSVPDFAALVCECTSGYMLHFVQE